MTSVSDMLRELAPDWSLADTLRAKKYVHDMLDTINTWDERAIRSRMKELIADDHVFAAVVYTMLPAPIRRFLDDTP